MIARAGAALLVLALPLGAQRTPCGRESVAACKRTLVTEASYGLRMAGGADQRESYDGPAKVNISANIGVVKPVSKALAFGPVATVGVWGDFYLGLGARVRGQLSPKVTLDLTPSYLIARGSSGSGHGMLDAAVMYRDIAGVSLQLASFQQFRYVVDGPDGFGSTVEQKPALFVGLRLGSKPGRYGMVADGLAFLGALTLFLIVCSNNGCD